MFCGFYTSAAFGIVIYIDCCIVIFGIVFYGGDIA